MNLKIRFEYAETYKMQNNLEKMYDSFKNIYEYIYDPSMLARYYRLLGYYFIEKQNYDVAYSLYAISIYYENNEMAYREINYIKQQTKNPSFKKTTQEILNLLKQQNIPITISQSNLNQLKNLANEKQIIERQPELIQYLNDVISTFSNTINESTKIQGLTITTPNTVIEKTPKNDSKSIIDVATNMATMMNFSLHAKQLSIPLLNNFKMEKPQEPQVVFYATDGMFVMQLVSDGPMRPNETFEQRINLIVKSTINFMKNYSSSNNDKSLFYYKDYSNGIFNYKIYVQDFIVDVNKTTKVIRFFNAYFIEPRFNDFYQLIISIPPLKMPTEILKLGVVDTNSDPITQSLDNLLKSVMDKLKYKNSQSLSNDDRSSKSVEGLKTIKKDDENGNDENINEDEYSAINNEYDYSTIIPTAEAISYLVQYCDNVYKQFITLVDEDEKRNEQFKQEFKNYNYKKTYGEKFEIYIRKKGYNDIICKDFASFQSTINDGNLKNVNILEIKMEMDYRRGKGNELTEHENLFTIIFKPYEITFARKSSYNELQMNKIENEIKEILDKFQVVNTIFCTKEVKIDEKNDK